VNHSERLETVLYLLSQGPASVKQLASAADIPLTSAWNAVADLVLRGKIAFYGYLPNPGAYGGAPVKLYVLASQGPHGKPLMHYAKKEKNAKRTEWKPQKPRHFAGSGVIAGRITIGRGSKWGAGLA